MNIFDVFPEISQNEIFKGADKLTLEKYLRDDNISLLSFSQGQTVISPNSDDIKIGIVVNGILEITTLNGSHKGLIKTAGRGSIFGIANLYASDCHFPTHIIAKTNTEIVMIRPEIFREMIESDIKLTRNFLGFLGQKIVYLNKKIVSYTAGNTEQKLAYFLIENEIDGVLSSKISISDIAVMLDMGRASLYRAFDSLEADGIIERKGRMVKILDKTKLKNIYKN